MSEVLRETSRRLMPPESPLSLAAVRSLFPHLVGVGVRTAGDGRPSSLFPEEAAIAGPRAVDRRRQDVALGRDAAHDALAELTGSACVVGRGERGEPIWPAGVVGSITHSGQIAVAVVGPTGHYRGIGIDLEVRNVGLSEGAVRIVCSQEETTWANAAPVDLGTQTRLALAFSAKEAVFKALFPVERVWLDFRDVELQWQEGASGFEAQLRRAAGRDFPEGSIVTVSCRVFAETVFSAVAV